MHFKAKFRRSTLKSVENLKFIPINLHLEHFQVERSLMESECYDFTSVGAFTTAHTNKPTFTRPIESLMFFDRPFNFIQPSTNINNNNNKNQNAHRQLIENEILMNFYSLKILIQLGNHIKILKEQKVQSIKVRKFYMVIISINSKHFF